MLKKVQKGFSIWIVLLVVIPVLSGCGGGGVAAVVEKDTAAIGALSEEVEATALDITTELALGTLRLEDTENAVTPEQATTLLPLWQALQSGALQGDAETEAVLAQIKGTMTEAQVAAIAAMHLTLADAQSWMEEAGMGPEAAGMAPPADAGGAELSQEELEARRAEFENLSEEEGAALSEQFGGEGPGGAPPDGEAQGPGRGAPPAGGGRGRAPGAPGGGVFLIQSLVELLTQRATE